MRRGFFQLAVCISLMLLSYSAMAANFVDELDGENPALRESAGVCWTNGHQGLAACFNTTTGYLKYASSFFPAEGTIGFYLKPQGGYTIIDTAGRKAASAGDMAITLLDSKQIRFRVYNATTKEWHKLTSNSYLNEEKWYYIAVSYGSQGMKLYINGQQDGTFDYEGDYKKGRNINRNLYMGDYALDSYSDSILGAVDVLKVSAYQSDLSVISAPLSAPVPEPSTFAAMGTGIVSAFAFMRRRRK